MSLSAFTSNVTGVQVDVAQFCWYKSLMTQKTGNVDKTNDVLRNVASMLIKRAAELKRRLRVAEVWPTFRTQIPTSDEVVAGPLGLSRQILWPLLTNMLICRQ